MIKPIAPKVKTIVHSPPFRCRGRKKTRAITQVATKAIKNANKVSVDFTPISSTQTKFKIWASKTPSFFNRFYKSTKYFHLTEKEKDATQKIFLDLWQRYKKEGLELKDVVSFRLKVPLKGGKPSLTSKYTLSVTVKQKDKNGKYIKDKNGNFKFKKITLVEDTYEDDHYVDFTGIDFKTFNEDNRQAFASKQKQHIYLSTKASKSEETYSQRNLCFAHAARNLLDAIKSPKDQEKEFAKNKEDRSAEIAKWRDKYFKNNTDQQDAHALLCKCEELQKYNPQFEVTRKRFILNEQGKKTLLSPPPKDPKKKIEPPVELIPSLSFPEKRDQIHFLQTLVDDFFTCKDKEKLSTIKRQGKDHQIIEEQIRYNKKPPFLLLQVKRYDNRSKIISEPLVVEDEITLEKGKHIQQKASSKQKASYTLKGFICHSGSLRRGHYVAYVKRTINGKNSWYIYNNLGSYGVKVDETTEEFKNKRDTEAHLFLYKASKSV